MENTDKAPKLKQNQHAISIAGPISDFNPETGEEEVLFSLEHLFPQDRAIIQQALSKIDGFNDIFFIEKGKTNEVLNFFIPVKNINDFYNKCLPQFQQAISSAIAGKRVRGGQMKTEYVNLETLPAQIRHRIDATPLQRDVDAATENITNNWAEVLEKLNDPEVRKRLLAYEMTDTFAANYGWKLSDANIVSVLQQKPDATFVTSLEMWEKHFMHKVNPGAQRIIIKKPQYNATVSLDDLNAAAAKRNFGTYSNALKASHNSTQTQMGVVLAAKQKGAHSFGDTIVYDVSDTTPMNKEHDKWAEEMGLMDNLRVIPNAPLAAELKAQGKGGEDIKKSGISKERLKVFRERLFKFCKKVGADISELKYANDETAIEQMTFEIGKVYAAQANILKESNKNSFAAKLCMAVAATVGLQLSYASRFIGSEKVEKKAVGMIWEAYIEIIRCIPKQENIQESIGAIKPLSFPQFLELFKELGTEIMSDKEAENLNELKRRFKKLCQ